MIADPYALAGFQVKNGTPLKSQLGFLARSVIIDNNTSSYLYSPDAGRYAAPGQGVAFSFPGTHAARILWQAPPGKSQIAAIPTEEAQVVFFAAPTPPGGGYAAPSNQALPWVTPNQIPIFKNRIGVGTTNVTPAVSGKQIYLFGVELAVVAAAAGGAGVLQDTSGNKLAEIRCDSIHEIFVTFSGAPLTQGVGLDLLVAVGGTVDCTTNLSQV